MFDDKRRRRDKEEFDKMVREMQKIIEEVFRSAFEGFGNAFAEGFSVKFSPEGEIKMERIGREDEGDKDIIEDDDKIYVTLRLPDIDENSLDIKIVDGDLEIIAGDRIRIIELPAPVNENKIKAIYKNGVLDIELEKI
ncbi:MAG: Hsp20/alpha crystallin family protein [Thermoplasmata archaeon]|nr:Hsp20/alpha crystallin family protein [Thermoplasmata archaeon]